MSVPPTLNALWSRRVLDYTKHSLPYFGLVTPASATIAFSFIPLLSLYYSLTMGRRSFWRGEDARKKWHECCLESGYISRAHEEDTKQGEYNRVNQTKELHHQHVVLFTEWVL